MNEWKRILSDVRRRTAILCIPLLCLFLFFYQKCDGDFTALLTDAEEYRQLLETYEGSTPAEIAEVYPYTWSLTDNEQRLVTQAEHQRDYAAYLERVQIQAANMQASSLFSSNRNSFVYRNIIRTAADFAGCTAENIHFGNYRAVQDWLEFSLADWGFLAAILLLVMSFMEERQKGLAAIVRSCPGGRGKLQGARLRILLVYSAGMTALLYYVPLLLSLCIDGGWSDLVYPVQSMAEFQKCTAQMSVFGFLCQFFLVKTACGFLLGTLVWFALTFLNQVQLSWLLTAAAFVAEYLLYTLIPAQSIFSPLRHVNVFSYVFTARLYTQYVNINFLGFPVQNLALLMLLLVALILILGTVTVWLMPRRYPFGNKDRLGKWVHLWNRLADFGRRRLGILGFEWYKLLFMTASGLFLLLGILSLRGLLVNSGAYYLQEDGLYRQYLAQVQGPVTQDTWDYLANARAYLDTMEIDTYDYQEALDRLEETISSLPEGAWLVDQTVFLSIYGEKASYLQRQHGLYAMIYLVICLSPLFACEANGDVRKVLRSTPGGRQKLFWAKYLVAVGVTLAAWLLVFVQQWQSAVKWLGDTILSAPCSSIEMLRGFPMTVGTLLIFVYLCKGVAMLIVTNLCVFFGEWSGRFDKTFLWSGGVLLLPAAIYSYNVDALRIFTPLTFLADGNVLLAGAGRVVLFACWMALSVFALLYARRRWCRTSG
ncbi:MAG: hypothetical protein LUJ09_06880 [Firmicutes bacterium]|nr:hypothetical protein [Bacillota bacterium]